MCAADTTASFRVANEESSQPSQAKIRLTASWKHVRHGDRPTASVLLSLHPSGSSRDANILIYQLRVDPWLHLSSLGQRQEVNQRTPFRNLGQRLRKQLPNLVIAMLLFPLYVAGLTQWCTLQIPLYPNPLPPTPVREVEASHSLQFEKPKNPPQGRSWGVWGEWLSGVDNVSMTHSAPNERGQRRSGTIIQ